nr:alpha-ketoglutarate-dependent dioxygenase abh1 [Quercus suber]
MSKPASSAKTMDSLPDSLNAHARPPESIRRIYKKYQGANARLLHADQDLIDFSADDTVLAKHTSKIARSGVSEESGGLAPVFSQFLGQGDDLGSDPSTTITSNLYSRTPYKISALPGSHLSSPPKDLSVHKVINTTQLLNKKLRWMTLGGQYNWTNKVYPSGHPPAFPHDVKRLIENIFPMKAEAAIVNLYSPGDTLSLHRDVSEECDRPLVSVSIGCDAIFVAGICGANEESSTNVAAMRLRSGDAVLMTGASRFAWHGVPKILEGTCPVELADWPAGGSAELYDTDTARWQGWMKKKRINLNVRQMFP